MDINGDSKQNLYWVTTGGGYRLGPYNDYCCAIQAAQINFGFEGWTITKITE